MKRALGTFHSPQIRKIPIKMTFVVKQEPKVLTSFCYTSRAKCPFVTSLKKQSCVQLQARVFAIGSQSCFTEEAHIVHFHMPNFRVIWNVGISITSFHVLQLNICEYFRKIYNKTVISSWLTSKQHPLLPWNTFCHYKTGSLASTHGREGTLENFDSSRVCHGSTRITSCRGIIGYFYLLLISFSCFFFHGKVSIDILIRSSCLLLFGINVHPFSLLSPPQAFIPSKKNQTKIPFLFCLYLQKKE